MAQDKAIETILSRYPAAQVRTDVGPDRDRALITFPDGQVVLDAAGGVVASSATSRASEIVELLAARGRSSITGTDPCEGYDPACDLLVIERPDGEICTVPPWRCAMAAQDHVGHLKETDELLQAWARNILGRPLRVWRLDVGATELCARRPSSFHPTRRSRPVSAATMTNGEILARHQISTEGIEHLDLEVPILNAPQRQGDVLIVPVDAHDEIGKPVPATGVTVVRGETEGGNAHILHNLDGECFWHPAPDADTELVQGWVTVPDGCSATLIHTQEHNVIGLAPGKYEVKRQREFAGEWRRVSD